MKLIEDWRRALRGYSFWAMVCGALTFLVPLVAWKLFALDLDPNIFGYMYAVFMVAGFGGRLIAQPDTFLANLWRVLLFMAVAGGIGLLIATRSEAGTLEPQDRPIAQGATVTEVEIIDYALPYLERLEGVRLVAYRDVVGIWTICAGTTRGVTDGMRKTAAECRAIMRAEATEYWRAVAGYMTETTRRLRITVPRGASWDTFTINVGKWAAGHSTAMARLNAGWIAGSCRAMTWWNKAGGKIYSGLVRRRTIESGLCMIGVE